MCYDEKILAKCIMTEVIISSIIAMATVLGYETVVSPLFAISFLIPLIYVSCTVRSFPKELLMLMVLCLLHVLFNGMQYGGMLGFDYLKKVIMFLSFIYLVYYAVDIRLCKAIYINLIKIAPVIAGVVMVVSYFYLGKTEVWGGGIILGFTNPNTAGMWLFHLILYGILYVLECPKKKIRLVYIPVIIALLRMLALTKTRSCYIALFFLAMLLCLRIFKIQANKFLCFVMLLLPLVYALIYINIAYSDWFQTKFAFMISEGKSLTSRVKIWKEAFEVIRNHFVLGDYYGISNGTGVSQLHNTHLDVLCSYGFIPFLLFIKILYKCTVQTIEKANTFYKYAAFASFCAVLIMGTFEASIVSGAMGLNLLTIGFLVLATVDEEKMEEL